MERLPTSFFTRGPGRDGDPLHGKFAAGSASASGGQGTPLTALAGLYWFVEVPGHDDRRAARSGRHALSTEEVAALMDEGHAARTIRGPFPTREEAERRFEDYWEALLGGDDD